MTVQYNAPVTAPAPDCISAYSHGWKKLWKPFWMLVLVGIIYYAISAAAGFIPLAGIFLTAPLAYGMSYAFLKAARGNRVEVTDLFEVFKNYWNAVGASLLTGLMVGVPAVIIGIIGVVVISTGAYGIVTAVFIFGILAVAIIFVTCKFAFIPFLIVDRKMSAWQSISTSWKMTDGYTLQLFLIQLLGIPIIIAGFICLILGGIVASMWISMATASLYYAVASRANWSVPAPLDAAPPPPPAV